MEVAPFLGGLGGRLDCAQGADAVFAAPSDRVQQRQSLVLAERVS